MRMSVDKTANVPLLHTTSVIILLSTFDSKYTRYGTAPFKLHTRECITRVYLMTPVSIFENLVCLKAPAQQIHERCMHVYGCDRHK